MVNETPNNEISIQNSIEPAINSSSEDVDRAAVGEFLEFLDKNKEYLQSGLGAFHTDNHSNW